MNFPLIPEYQTDILNNNPGNEINGEPFTLPTSETTRILVPLKGPFFVKSLKLYNGNMEPLTKADYRIYKQMAGLTELTAKPVACMIEITNPLITSGFVDYDTVGEFSLFDNGMLRMITEVMGDSRPPDWNNITNKPTHFPAKLHGHSLLYEIVAFKDMVELLDLLFGLIKQSTKKVIEVKINHYLDLYTNYINVYKAELLENLNRHMASKDSHGLTKDQVNLGLVDNFPTVVGIEALNKRNDAHLTPNGLKTIIDNFGTNIGSLFPANKLPISQFGNSNFIPPSIDGSFEGLGGQSEMAGICQETDGSVVFLENRFDGRVDGLYYSVIQNIYSENRKREYSAYRYTHQRIENDNAIASRIAQGSGGEVILVADKEKNYFYVGLTNGSLNPARHVLSRIDMSELMAVLPAGNKAADHIDWMQVMLMGDWIYISFAHSYQSRSLIGWGANERRYRYFYRVAKADVAAQLPVTANAVRVSYTDPDGVSRTNQLFWRFYTPVGTFPNYTRCYFPIKQTTGTLIYGNAYSQQCLVAEIPNKPGKYVMKIIGAFLGSYASASASAQFQTEIEVTYEFDPATNVMTLLHQTPKPTLDFTNLFIDWLNPPDNWRSFAKLVYAWDRQGLEVLPDGSIIGSVGDYSSFPRGYKLLKPKETKTKYATIAKQWNTSLGGLEIDVEAKEGILSPLPSGIKPKSFLLGNGGDFYEADAGNLDGKGKLYYRQAAGGLAARAGINNTLLNNIRSRPLSNKVWEVRGDARVGGATITVPSSQLASYGTDLGDLRFCVGTQRRYLDLPDQSAEWTQPADTTSIKVISAHTTRINAKGQMEIVPTASITYPAAIVNLLKREVDLPSAVSLAPDVVVMICDPTGSLTDKFGWLPVLVFISWGRVGTTERHDTMLSITPVYSGTTNKTVTSYTVLDKIHLVIPVGAVDLTSSKWGVSIGGDTIYPAHGSPRVGYYLNGNVLTGYFDSGIQALAQGDRIQMYGEFRYANRNSSKRWTTTGGATKIDVGNAGGNAHRSVVPDNGVSIMVPHPEAAGGAATIFNAGTYNALLGSVYPEVGWVIFFQQPIDATFNGVPYVLPKQNLDLRDIDAAPANKVFYVYASLIDGTPVYEISQAKRLENGSRVWVAKVTTGSTSILTIERFNVFSINGKRVSEIKRGNSIPASSGLANTEGQLPWIRTDELLP